MKYLAGEALGLCFDDWKCRFSAHVCEPNYLVYLHTCCGIAKVNINDPKYTSTLDVTFPHTAVFKLNHHNAGIFSSIY